MRIGLVLCVAAASAVLGAMAATPLQDAQAKGRADQGAGGQMSATEMEAMTKAGTPGPEHRALAEMAGNWKSEITCTMKPGAPSTTSSGTDEFSMIMGDRYLAQDHSGTLMDMPFDGHGLYGFNNVTGQYEMVWLDSMGTAIMTARGTKDAATDTITWKGEFQCPINGLTQFRETLRKVNNDKYEFKMYTKYAQTPEFLGMEITYTRQS